MEFNFKSYDNSKQSISYCEVDKCKAVIKLKKCLQEIKEIAKPFCEECKEFGNMPNERYCMCCNYNKILQKISECEEGDDDYLSEHWLFNNRSNE